MRLLAHEVAHTLQNSDRINRLPAANSTIRRSSADDLVSSMDNTADAVLDDVVAGSFYTSNDFEERIRKLSASERKRLRDMMAGQTFVDQDIADELINVVEWNDDLIITDLELLGGNGESKGKLGRHTPSVSLRLFQRALIQWGCESASPGRNPLPQWGADGVFGGEFRRGVRQFQRAEGLSADGTAGPNTVRAMARELYGINMRQEVEREVDIDRANDQLEEQEADDAEYQSKEDRINRFIWKLYEEGERYRKDGSVQYEANVSMLVAQRIRGFGAETISEGLERVSLQDPDFYDHVLFGGRLISSLQQLGVYGIEYKPPSDADFLDGFIIASNEVEHASPLNSPEFSGWDVPKIFAGFTVGTGMGIARGISETIDAVKAMFTAEFWNALYTMVPKLIREPNFRFEIGQAAAEMLYKQLTELNASQPYDYGEKLGTLFGMVVFEVALALFTGGVGAAAVRSLKGAQLLAKFPRLQRLAKKIASTSLVRAGAVIGSKIGEAAIATLERVRKLIAGVRKSLPDLSSNAKIGRQLDELAEAEILEALAAEKELIRKLDELEMEQAKLELALEQPEPDYDQVERLASSIETRAKEIEDFVTHSGPGTKGISPASVPKQTLTLVEQGRNIQKVSKLPPRVFAAEIQYVDAAKPRSISLKIWDKDFDSEVELPNKHTYRHDSDRGETCRFSDGDIDNCYGGRLGYPYNHPYYSRQILHETIYQRVAKEIPNQFKNHAEIILDIIRRRRNRGSTDADVRLDAQAAAAAYHGLEPHQLGVREKAYAHWWSFDLKSSRDKGAGRGPYRLLIRFEGDDPNLGIRRIMIADTHTKPTTRIAGPIDIPEWFSYA